MAGVTRKAEKRKVTQTAGVPKRNQPEAGVVASSMFFIPKPVPGSGVGMAPDCRAGRQGEAVRDQSPGTWEVAGGPGWQGSVCLWFLLSDA